MNIVIIEDEPRAVHELQDILSEILPQANIIAVLESIEQSIKWFTSNQNADLIFSDIALGDGQSFEIFRRVNVTSPVVFCTAYDEYLMDAFETNAVSYLLKPISKEKVAKAIEQYNRMKAAVVAREKQPQNTLEQLLQQLRQSYKQTLLVHHKEKIIPLQLKDVAFFYLDGSLVQAITLDNQKYLLTISLEELEKMIDPQLFFRANRQYLISRNAIQNAERFFARKLVATLTVKTPGTVIISKAKASEFLQWLEGNN